VPVAGSVDDANVIVALDDDVAVGLKSYPNVSPSAEWGVNLGRYVLGSHASRTQIVAGSDYGIIYTEQREMPSLERLLTEHRVKSAVWERDTAQAPVAVSTALAAAVTAIGLTLLAVHVSGTNGPDPMLSAFLALAGLGLFATIVAALRTR
jgi:hypothetical protein